VVQTAEIQKKFWDGESVLRINFVIDSGHITVADIASHAVRHSLLTTLQKPLCHRNFRTFARRRRRSDRESRAPIARARRTCASAHDSLRGVLAGQDSINRKDVFFVALV
jgi:hypothetical protein